MSDQPKIGLALGSGAARGWVHFGVLQALEELGIEPAVFTGTSAGALVAGAHLLGIKQELEEWARELGPLSALKEFGFSLSRAGIIDPAPAFKTFRFADKNIEELAVPLGIVATDLATGEEVRITSGSVVEAVRASSSIPMVFHAARSPHGEGHRWLVDGALTNPVPVDLALELGAEKVIAVDLQAQSRTIERFEGSPSRELIVRPEPEVPQSDVFPPQVMEFFQKTRAYVEEQVALAKSRKDAKPQFIETAIATSDIYQSQLARAKLALTPPDVRITPDLRDYPPTAFDQPDDMITLGYEDTMAQKEKILALKEGA